MIAGGGGLKLHVCETGNPTGKAILFIHGLSQSHVAWRKQLHSFLAKDFHLIAMDIRGHGFSEKPCNVYGESKLWADDLRSVITALELKTPVLVGWSYGGAIMSDYVAFYGDKDIAGTCWVSAVPRVGAALRRDGLVESGGLLTKPECFSENVSESVEFMQKYVRMCTNKPLSTEEFYLNLGYNMMVPPYVRFEMLSRDLDNDSVVADMRKPMLLSYGELDPIVPLGVGKHIARLAKHAHLSIYPDVGHSPFLESTRRFNSELRQFRNEA